MACKLHLATFAFAAAIFMPVTGQTQSAKEWYSQYHVNRAAANRKLSQKFEIVRTRAVEHYKATKDTPRADYVATMKPDLLNLADRIATATVAKPDPPIESVIQKYIVDASAQSRLQSSNRLRISEYLSG